MFERFDATAAGMTVFVALHQAYRNHGRSRPIIEDAERAPVSYGQIVLGSMVLGDRFARSTTQGEIVGVMLPNVPGLLLTLFGLNAFGRVAALLNFTAGVRGLRSALQTAEIGTVLTSRRFTETARLDDVVRQLAATDTARVGRVKILYLEDIRREIGALDKVRGALRGTIATRIHQRHALGPDAPAVVLFTSGTEGTPKGVVLTSQNLVANAHQIFTHADGMLSPADVVLNPLPMFHAFGLTAGTLMPLFNGLKVVLYPSPLHYRQVTRLARDAQASILFATDTFLQGYARAAGKDDLASIRYVIAGAERVKDHTRALWGASGVTIIEGYGVTEGAPVLACNLPGDNRSGTVGRMLPGIEARLEPIAGITDGGRLLVRGPNLMAGYMLPDQPGAIVPPPGGWHDTGDIVSIDADGFVTILGRAKRYAKIGGEMVSLAAVDDMVAALWPEANHIVVAIPDPRKGEQLVLVTDKPDAERTALLRHAQAEGFPELWVPRAILVTEALPLLGSGKIDISATIEMVRKARPLP